MRILRDGLIARCPSFRVRCGVAGPAPPSLRPGRITSSCLKAFYLALLGGRTEREREREREREERRGENSKTYGIFFYPHTHLCLSSPPACLPRGNESPFASSQRSDITFRFARAELQACLQFLPLSWTRTYRAWCVCGSSGAPIPLFYPHNTTMHLWRLGLLEIGHHSLCLTLCVYSPLSISHRSTEAEKYRRKEREKERIFNRSVASSKIVSPLECGCAVHVLLKSRITS